MSFDVSTDQCHEIEPPAGPRRPRIALMGEFSAGKSTLANLMIGLNNLPVQVVATQLPPVWISHGERQAHRVDLEGVHHVCDPDALTEMSLADTAYVDFRCGAEILTLCQLIDLPGLSDPNMSSEVWERIIPHVDGVIWCSPATQAWRQSEAAVWLSMPVEVQQNSILLLTRADMVNTEKDRQKILTRVQKETAGTFAYVQPMSLTQAGEGEYDEALWEASGADEFVSNFMTVIERIQVPMPRDGTEEPIGQNSPEAARIDLKEHDEANIREDGGHNDASAYTPKFS